ncbi:hypothetical protein CJ179_12315 [Rhodococcus sp. ACS1]|uniref:LysR family transcriptional regulator n=1 Tax=Rhodococcus sp. ACS1 TaxID=2028570 RepID=UPI000BB0DFC4|nr:hypothetical protein CJ179_12315 [Rhodococcus sp. ACS1]
MSSADRKASYFTRSALTNLLITLDAVLYHQNATRAAEQLGVSQPAISAALRRLRRHFDDELLRRVGNRFQLTPLGMELRLHTRLVLDGVERAIAVRPCRTGSSAAGGADLDRTGLDAGAGRPRSRPAK